MSTIETFEELGYKKNVENGKITYSQDFGSGYFEIIFDLSENEIEIETNMEVVIENDLLLAINQQCKELGWLESESKQETNLDHYKDDIAELFIDNLAIVDGKPKRCVYTVCDERCDLHTDCDDETHYKLVKEWLKKPYQKPTFKLTQFEYDLLQSYVEGNLRKCMFKDISALMRMKEKGHFKNINGDELIKDILAKCEVVG